MSARGAAVLSRFPHHLAAGDPGKRVGAVVGSVADVLDVLTRELGQVRTAHRLGEAPTRADVVALAGVHGLAAATFGLAEARLDAVAAADPADPAALGELLALPGEALEALGDALPLLLARATGHRARLDLVRDVVRGSVGAHRVGNGTATALLLATGAYLGLGVERVIHAEDRWWHLAQCRDRLRLGELVPRPEVVAVEENPFREAELEPAPRRSGQRFRVLRGGLEDVDATVRVTGLGARTVRPMVVGVDAGQGLVFEGDVPDGTELRFEASGAVTLDGRDVTGSAWSFTGAVFASADEALPQRDFVFADARQEPAGRVARFAVTAPVADALDRASAFPHGGSAVGPLRLVVGESRWAAFVRVAHAGGAEGPAVPRTAEGRFDRSVLADGAAPLEPSLAVGFAWREREPFAVRVVLPGRLAVLDDEAGTTLRQPLRGLLDRYRAAGVDLRVEYADPRWTLGVGVLRDLEDDAVGTVIAGTQLWPDPAPLPSP